MEAPHLRGLQRGSTAMPAAYVARHEGWSKLSLLCGIAFALLFAAMIWLIRYEGYSVISQVPSELTAIGAPTRALWARLGRIDTLLEIAFGAAEKRGAIPSMSFSAASRCF